MNCASLVKQIYIYKVGNKWQSSSKSVNKQLNLEVAELNTLNMIWVKSSFHETVSDNAI